MLLLYDEEGVCVFVVFFGIGGGGMAFFTFPRMCLSISTVFACIIYLFSVHIRSSCVARGGIFWTRQGFCSSLE